MEKDTVRTSVILARGDQTPVTRVLECIRYDAET